MVETQAGQMAAARAGLLADESAGATAAPKVASTVSR